MQRRRFISVCAAASVSALVFAACGSDSDGSGAGDDETLPTPVATDAPASTEAPPATDAPADPADPVESDDEPYAVLEYGVYGGFTTYTFAFQMQPNVYVSSDGLVFGPGAAPAIYPGALVPPMTVRTITQDGIDALVAAADDAGMLAEVDYTADTMIADAGTATLRITVDGEEYVHEAYALGIGGPPGADAEETPERQALADFLEQLNDLGSIVGEAELGEPEPLDPTGYQFVAQEIADTSVFEIEPTVVPWPADTGVALADALVCTEIDREAVGDLFESSNELTFFADGGITYQLSVRPTLPGRTC